MKVCARTQKNNAKSETAIHNEGECDIDQIDAGTIAAAMTPNTLFMK